MSEFRFRRLLSNSKPSDSGTKLVFTVYGAFLDSYDDAASREHGSGWLLGKLGQSLQHDTAKM